MLGPGRRKCQVPGGVAAMARDPPSTRTATKKRLLESLFANPIGEDYFVRGFDGDSSYQWDDEWDDDAPSRWARVYWKH